jgi:hypothetical protein
MMSFWLKAASMLFVQRKVKSLLVFFAFRPRFLYIQLSFCIGTVLSPQKVELDLACRDSTTTNHYTSAAVVEKSDLQNLGQKCDNF